MKIFDLHNDFLTEKNSIFTRNMSYKCFVDNGVSTVCSAMWTSKINPEQCWEQLERASKFCKSKEGASLCIEDLHFVTKFTLHKLINLLPAYCSLTWNGENVLGCGVGAVGGLSSFGENVVKFLQNENICVDTAHLNERSFLDVAKISTKPIICSHTAFNSIVPNERNLKDYQIKIIEESGGIIGLCFVSQFIANKKRANITDIARQIEYYCDRYDISKLCIGSDFYGTNNLPYRLKKYKHFENLKRALIKRGFTETEINQIFFTNADNFFKKIN